MQQIISISKVKIKLINPGKTVFFVLFANHFPGRNSVIIQMIEFPQQGQNMLTPPHGYLASLLPNHALKAVDDQIITLFFHGKENFPDLRPLSLQWFLGIHKPGKGGRFTYPSVP